jgi:hypothetical protein
MIESDVVSWLREQNFVGDRIRPIRVDQSSNFPAIAYRVTSDSPSYEYPGQEAYTRLRIQLTLWVSTYTAGKALYRDLRQRLPSLVEKPSIRSAIISSIQDSFDPELTLYNPSCDITILGIQ